MFAPLDQVWKTVEIPDIEILIPLAKETTAARM